MATFYLKKLLLKEKFEKYVICETRKKIAVILQLILWLLAISIIIELNSKYFFAYRFVKSKHFEITTLIILSAVFTVSINLLFIYLLRIAKRKLSLITPDFKEYFAKFYVYSRIILWIITVSIILKSIIIDYSDFLDYTFFKISKTPITISDIIFGGIVIIIGQIILLLIKTFFRRQEKKKKLDIGTSFSIYRIVKYIIWIILLAIILETAGFELSILLAGSAALLVGLGFGVQQLFSDFVSGVLMIAEGNIKVGDYIEFNDIRGKVVSSNLRTTEIRTIENNKIIIPNTQLTSAVVLNSTKDQKNSRFSVGVGVAYGSDIELVERLILESVEDIKHVEKYPKPFVLFTNFGNSSLDFELIFWSEKEFSIERIKSNIRKQIDKKFRENNITIPFPQRDVHILKDL